MRVQKCKQWLSINAISIARIVSLGKYLVALSTAWGYAAEKQIRKGRGSGPSYRRKQLSVLYLLNDLLHHTKFHNDSSSAYATLAENIRSHMVELVRIVATYDRMVYVKHHKKIKTLLDEWSHNEYFDSSYTEKLRETASKAGNDGGFQGQKQINEISGHVEDKIDNWNQPKKDVPFVLPATHGDLSTPYYDLPAGNMMPHILPNSATPISTNSVKPIHLVPGPVDNDLVVALKDFLKDVDSLYAQNVEDDEGFLVDIDEMGQSTVRDEITGEVIGGNGYYGWSQAFCQRMKRRHGNSEIVRGRQMSISEEEGQSRYKRRRYSSSVESRSLSGDRSRTKSRSMDRMGNGQDGSYTHGRLSRHVYSRSRSPSRSRSRTDSQRFQTIRSRSRARSRSRSRSYSPPPQISTPRNPQAPSTMHTHASAPTSAPPLPHPMTFLQGVPIGPGGIPLPPPPPPNYNGPWPPPPPLGQSAGFASSNASYSGYSAFAPPPPPPPFPELSATYSTSVPSMPTGPRSYQNQTPISPENWSQQHSGATPGYGNNVVPANAQNNSAQRYGQRGRGRGGWR